MIDFLFLVSSGFILFAGLHAAITAFFVDEKKAHLALMALCFCVLGYQLATLGYFKAEDARQMVEILRWQTSFIILAIYLFAYNAYLLFQVKQRSYFLLFLGATTLILTVLNWLLPYGVRFSGIAGVHQVQLLGQAGSILNGVNGLTGRLVHLEALCMLVWVLYQFWRLSRQSQLTLSPFIALVLLQFIGTSYWGFAIDSQRLIALPISGFAFIPVLIVLSVALGEHFRRKLNTLYLVNSSLAEEQEMTRVYQIQAHRLVQLIEQTPDAMILADVNGKILSTNAASKTFWGRSLEQSELNLLSLFSRLYPDRDFSLAAIREKQPQVLPTIAAQLLPAPLNLSFPANMWLEFELSVTLDLDSKQVDLLVCHCRDITERYYSQQAFEYMAEGVSYHTGHSFFDGMIGNLAALFNAKIAFIGMLSKDQQSVTTLSLYMDGEKAENFSYALKDTPCQNVMDAGVCCYPSGIQAKFPKDILLQELGVEGYFGTPLLNERGRPLGILVVLDSKPVAPSEFLNRIMRIFASRASAEVQRTEAEKQTRIVAYEDYLTRLPNRASAHQYLNETLHSSQLRHSKATLIMADMDQFKTINDALGHDVGDDILRAMGQRLRNSLPSDLFIARLGGDEFIFICTDPKHDANQLAAQILNLMNQPITVAEHQIDISASIGVADINGRLDSHCDALDIMRRAELALYKSKKEGRSNYSIYEEALESEAKERMELQAALKKAITASALSMHFQPQIDSNGQFYGAEALIRWIDPQLGFVSPALFIPIAEESGIIHQLGEWINQTCFSALKTWLDQGKFQGHLSINVSAWQFALPLFAEHLIEQVLLYEIPPQYVCVELTETSLLSDIEDTITKLHKLRHFGLTVALDDFGTGYSSLAYLRDLPIDILKIDKAFIDELEKYQSSPLTESMIAIGHNMALKVIAEGVETASQVEQLKALNCDIMQGYYYAKPMAEPEFLEWLQRYI